MMHEPRVFIGTMHFDEGDFDRCVEKIRSQVNVKITHHIIAGMPEKDAHNALGQAWNEVHDDHDMYVKIDADMVLRADDTIWKIWEHFQSDNNVTGIQCPLHDYMSNDMIYGLNCCNSDISFITTHNSLQPERNVEIGHKIVLKNVNGQLDDELVPVGYHCHFATERQAFRYGVHRALKNHDTDILRVLNAWYKSHDRIRGFALIGAKMSRDFSAENHNYTDSFFQQMFDEAIATYDEQIAYIAAC